MSINRATAVSLLAKLNLREISSVEIVQELLHRSERLKRLNVFVHLDWDDILDQAQ